MKSFKSIWALVLECSFGAAKKNFLQLAERSLSDDLNFIYSVKQQAKELLVGTCYYNSESWIHVSDTCFFLLVSVFGNKITHSSTI